MPTVRWLSDGDPDRRRAYRAAMARPAVEGIIDLMISFPSPRPEAKYHFMAPLLKDADSQSRSMPAGYMFKDVPEGGPEVRKLQPSSTPWTVLLAEMDKYGIAVGLIGIGPKAATRALADHPDRFAPSLEVDPNDISGTVQGHPPSPPRARDQGGLDLPGRVQPPGADVRPALLPHVPDVRRPRHPDHRQRRHSRSPGPVRLPGRHALRRGLLRLP